MEDRRTEEGWKDEGKRKEGREGKGKGEKRKESGSSGRESRPKAPGSGRSRGTRSPAHLGVTSSRTVQAQPLSRVLRGLWAETPVSGVTLGMRDMVLLVSILYLSTWQRIPPTVLGVPDWTVSSSVTTGL